MHLRFRTTCFAIALVLCFSTLLSGCGSLEVNSPTTPKTILTSIVLTPGQASLRVGNTLQFTATVIGSSAAASGSWSVIGGSTFGVVSQAGLYTAPASVPTGPVTVQYSQSGTTGNAQVAVLSPTPVLNGVAPSTITQSTTSLVLTGSGFEPSTQILIDGVPVQTQFVSTSQVSSSVTVPASATNLSVQVSNPDPGGILSAMLSVPVSLARMSVSPTSLAGGPISVSVTMPGVGPGSTIQINGQTLTTTAVNGNVVQANGYLPPWAQGDVPISVTAPDGSTVLSQATEPITPTAVSYDVAARFATQAAWGPRPDVVLHIQQVGLQNFVNEQLQAPVGSYDVTTTNPIRSYFRNITSGNALLRLRTAWAFQTFIPGQTFFSDHNKALPWEQTLERDAFTNYRQIIKDAANDPNIGLLLNLAGNAASSDPNVHPNQNFARELMQLFSIGTVMLNQDGSPKLDGTGQQIPAYGDDTVVDMSRCLTGWNWGTPANPWFTYAPWAIDFSVNLVPVESQHDHGRKKLFGSYAIPAGQTTAQDLDSAIEAIMEQPNTAPFVSHLLIQRLTESQPSPGYVERVASVFRDNGKGMSGDLSAVITAILLDPEARAGDTQPNATLGFVQDPLYQQMFMMSVLQISGEDDQATYIFNNFSETFWNPGSVFGYFSPNYLVPGTALNSPEFQLLTNFTDIQRSQFLYSVVTRQQPGFNNGFAGWLYENFTTVPAMVEALDHLLYHGTMTDNEKQIIETYCDGVSDPQLKLESAVFLAMNADSYLVSH